MLRAITLDFWGTLYQNAWAKNERLRLLGDVLAEAGQPRSPDALEAAYTRGWDLFGRIWSQEHRPLRFEHWLAEMLASLQVDLPQQTRRELQAPIEEAVLHSSPPVPVPGVTEVVPRLAQHYRLGLISDVGLTPGRVMREFLRRDGLLEHLSALTFSDELGLTKPRPEAFLSTLEALGVPPERAAHVGDLPETDLRGARDVGMRTVLFLGVSNREDGRPLADAVFSDYAELEGLLQQFQE